MLILLGYTIKPLILMGKLFVFIFFFSQDAQLKINGCRTPAGSIKCCKTSSSPRRMWCHWRINGTLWKISIFYDFSFVIISNSEHVPHIFTYISSKMKTFFYNKIICDTFQRQFFTFNLKFTLYGFDNLIRISFCLIVSWP